MITYINISENLRDLFILIERERAREFQVEKLTEDLHESILINRNPTVASNLSENLVGGGRWI